MDFPYLAKVAKLNIAALAAMASAPPPPEPKVEGAVSTDTTVSWIPTNAASFNLRWRRTDSNRWEQVLRVARSKCPQPKQVMDPAAYQSDTPGALVASVLSQSSCKITLPHIRVDDWVFGVSSVSKDGFESPVASAVPGGAFKPYIAPPKK
jgi:hypothetical protein